MVSDPRTGMTILDEDTCWKLFSGRVVLEADGYDPATGQTTWTGHPTQWFVRAHPREITGRRFARGGRPAWSNASG